MIVKKVSLIARASRLGTNVLHLFLDDVDVEGLRAHANASMPASYIAN